LRFVVLVLAPEALPRLVEVEDIGVEDPAWGVYWIVNADEELRKFREVSVVRVFGTGSGLK
jgi:hypothetical protein